ncbi:MAG: hypothetical protein GY943_10930, partial [Chloroflexi bacterium]|nr:hypothetical protein [Chloroflexota bacterium]
RITIEAGVDDEVVGETAVALPAIQQHINGKTIRKIIVVPNKLVNIVV